MKNAIICTLLFFGFSNWSLALNNFQPKNEWISFAGSVPPALMYITDSHGNRAGADPSLSVDQNGMEGDGLHGLEEIPGSFVSQENIQNSITGQPSKHTNWYIQIPDGGKQTYSINLKGITRGSSRTDVSFGKVGQFKSVQKFKLNYFISSGTTKQYTVNYDPAQLSISVMQIVGNSDLLTDVKTACQLNQITSRHVCDDLEKKAEAIQDALNGRHEEQAKDLIKSFLHMLGESRPGGCKEDDDHGAVKESALTILKEDAKALLAQIEKEDHGHHDQHGNKGK